MSRNNAIEITFPKSIISLHLQDGRTLMDPCHGCNGCADTSQQRLDKNSLGLTPGCFPLDQFSHQPEKLLDLLK